MTGRRRGVLYIVWGDGVKDQLERSVDSLRRFHPELPVHVEELPTESSLLDKARMMQMTPFEERPDLYRSGANTDGLDPSRETRVRS